MSHEWNIATCMDHQCHTCKTGDNDEYTPECENCVGNTICLWEPRGEVKELANVCESTNTESAS